jgi:hypothetical protein
MCLCALQCVPFRMFLHPSLHLLRASQALVNLGRVLKAVDSLASLCLFAIVYLSVDAAAEPAAVRAAVSDVRKWLLGPERVEFVGVSSSDEEEDGDSGSDGDGDGDKALNAMRRAGPEFDDDHTLPASCKVRAFTLECWYCVM